VHRINKRMYGSAPLGVPLYELNVIYSEDSIQYSTVQTGFLNLENSTERVTGYHV